MKLANDEFINILRILNLNLFIKDINDIKDFNRNKINPVFNKIHIEYVYFIIY